jgi:hypothetical protein
MKVSTAFLDSLNDVKMARFGAVLVMHFCLIFSQEFVDENLSLWRDDGLLCFFGELPFDQVFARDCDGNFVIERDASGGWQLSGRNPDSATDGDIFSFLVSIEDWEHLLRRQRRLGHYSLDVVLILEMFFNRSEFGRNLKHEAIVSFVHGRNFRNRFVRFPHMLVQLALLGEDLVALVASEPVQLEVRDPDVTMERALRQELPVGALLTRQVLLLLVELLDELLRVLQLRGFAVQEVVLACGGLDVAEVAVLLVGVFCNEMMAEVVEALFLMIADGAKNWKHFGFFFVLVERNDVG